MCKQLTGEPVAGEPHTGFGGMGGESRSPPLVNVEIQRAGEAGRCNGQLAVMPTTFPISRLALEVRDGEYDNFVFPDHVDNREGNFLGNTRRVPCLYGDPANGNDTANATAASTDCRNRFPRPISIAS